METAKIRYGNRLSFVPVDDGHVVLFRSRNGVVPVYKIQTEVETKQRIKFFETAEKIGKKYGLTDKSKGDRQVDYE